MTPDFRLRRGFTLIELLIVIAILAILSIGVGHLIDQTLRGQAELQLRSDLQSESSGAFSAIATEACVARECRVLAVGESGGFAVLALRVPPAALRHADDPPALRWVVYRVEDGKLLRVVYREEADLSAVPVGSTWGAAPDEIRAVQVLATHVTCFDPEPASGGVLRLTLSLGGTWGEKPVRVGGATEFALPEYALIMGKTRADGQAGDSADASREATP